MPDTILIYDVIAPSDLRGSADTVARALLNTPPLRGEPGRLAISPVSGCISYVDQDALFANRRPDGLPSRRDDVERIANTWLEAARKALGSSRRKAAKDLASLLPNGLKVALVAAVSAPQSSFPDHWLVIFALDLQTGLPGAASSAPATATLELRIGDSGRIVALRSTWRAVSGARRFAQVPPPEGGGILFYSVAGADELQQLVTPYYFMPNASSPLPASAASLAVQIADEPVGGGGVRLRAHVARGAQQDAQGLSFSWGAWRPDRIDLPNIALGDGATVEIADPGIYGVVLQVRDANPPQVVNAERMVLVAAPAERPLTS